MSSVYETGYIYKILTNDKEYIGSTNNFILRKSKHVSNCKSKSKKNDTLLYRNMREANGKFFMSIISIHNNITRKDLLELEEENRCLFKTELNMIKCKKTKNKNLSYLEKYSK